MKYLLSEQKFEKKQIASIGNKWVINCNMKEVVPESGKPAIFMNVAIWKDRKDGSVFPNFDALKGGDTVEGNLYTAATGKQTLYPIAERKQGAFAGGGNPAKMMEKKTEAIKASQDRKEESVMIASTAKAATDIIIAQWGAAVTQDNWKEEWTRTRRWLVAQWENVEGADTTPVADTEEIPF